jgi:hypothetical protein
LVILRRRQSKSAVADFDNSSILFSAEVGQARLRCGENAAELSAINYLPGRDLVLSGRPRSYGSLIGIAVIG